MRPKLSLRNESDSSGARTISGTHHRNRHFDQWTTEARTCKTKIIRPTRREALVCGGAVFGSQVVGPGFPRAAECVLTSRQIDGPFHIPDVEDRGDLGTGKPGIDLVLRMRVVDANACNPIPGARTEIWSCDALGNYSGHPDVDPNVPPGFGGPTPGPSWQTVRRLPW